MRKFKSSASLVAAAAGLVCSFGATAAAVDKDELAAMTAEAKKKGSTPVVVHLESVSLAEMSADLAGVKSRMASKAGQLVAELGKTAWTGGRWENGIGQVGLNVTEDGLKILQNSSNAVHFYRGTKWSERTALNGQDGRFEEIERQLEAQGFAEVEVVLNADGIEFEVARNGALRFQASDKAVGSAVSAARRLFGQLTSSEAVGKEAAASRFEAMAGQAGASMNPQFTVRVNREGLEKIVNSKDVRSVRPVGFIDKRATRFDEEALAVAERNGTAEVIITVRNPLAGGALSKSSFDATTRSNRRTIEGVLATAGVKSKLKDISEFGVVTGHVTADELKALRAGGDSRLLSVELNRPVAGVNLMTSTVAMNLPPAWNAGFRGTGQNLIVVDTGVQSNHRFLQRGNDTSKVFFEACFGTNGQTAVTPGGPLVTFESNCLSQNVTGDSPLGLVGSAAPRLNCAGNSSPTFAACHHGTHVAGIAAGRNSPTYVAGFQGVANEADIVAVQVFSFDAARVANPQVFSADLVAAMQAVAGAMTQGTLANPFTVNMSLGGDASYNASCPTVNSAITTAVQSLFNVGVPVVVSTGNNGSRGAISFPACVPRVVKVGALENNALGTAIASFTNLARPVNFAGDFFWMAPGGGGGTFITSSINSATTVNGLTQATAGLAGTSQAAPHVAGLYALVKAAVPGISVDDVSNWIQANASLPLSGVCLGSTPCTDPVAFRRIRLPNF